MLISCRQTFAIQRQLNHKVRKYLSRSRHFTRRPPFALLPIHHLPRASFYRPRDSSVVASIQTLTYSCFVLFDLFCGKLYPYLTLTDRVALPRPAYVHNRL